jgi:NTE family protein
MGRNPGRPDGKPKAKIQAGDGWSTRILRRRPEQLNLALQGGGAHGAFTWGVLARLLATGIRIEGISGASAGALNAVALAAGWRRGGAAGAAQALDELWREIGRLAQLSPLRAGGLTQMAADFAAQYLSPYQLNPLGANPLRAVLERLVDFERLRAVATPRLFIAATNVATGRARIFRNAELSMDAVLASTCLPQLHPAIMIEGEPYWDGGFSANPPLIALVEGSRARDLVLVQINPMVAERMPRTPSEIRNRVAEIAFGRPSSTNSSACGTAPGHSVPSRGSARVAAACTGIACTRSTAAPSFPGSTPAPRWIRHGHCCWSCARAAGWPLRPGCEAMTASPRPTP